MGAVAPQELAEERKSTASIQKRLDELESAESKRQTKAAERKEDYEKATQQRIDQAMKDARKQWDADQAIRDKRADAKLHLVKAGFKNEKWLRGALADFDHENQTAEEFAKSQINDESNKPFLETASKGPGGNPDPHPTPKNATGLLTPAEIQALRASGKPEDAARADEAAEALWVANEGSTGLPT